MDSFAFVWLTSEWKGRTFSPLAEGDLPSEERPVPVQTAAGIPGRTIRSEATGQILSLDRDSSNLCFLLLAFYFS